MTGWHETSPADGRSLAVVTVVRDDLPGLLATRESLREQTNRAFQWIVVDGDSRDDTAGWLSAHHDETTWWRSAPDDGPYDAMNVGLAAALQLGAAYVLFLNAGDRLVDADSVGRLRASLTVSPLAPFLYGDALERMDDGSIVKKSARSHRWAAWGMFTHHQAILYRCADIADSRFDLRFGIAADYAFTLAMMRKSAESPRQLDFPVCIFAPAGLSARDPARGRHEQRLIRKEMLSMGWLPNTAISGLQRLSLTMRCVSPEIYRKVRFRENETKFLSGAINHNQ